MDDGMEFSEDEASHGLPFSKVKLWFEFGSKYFQLFVLNKKQLVAQGNYF